MKQDQIRYFVVDAFTDRPFSGNPAAVVRLNAWPNDTWLQNVAMEMNLSETAFLVPNDDGFDLRWFTPAVEVDLCGHATLASACAIFQTGQQHELTRRATCRREWLRLKKHCLLDQVIPPEF